MDKINISKWHVLKIIAFYTLGPIFCVWVVIQGFMVWNFINAGPRFTAFDGQMLCHRLQRLELKVLGESKMCDFMTPSKQRQNSLIDTPEAGK